MKKKRIILLLTAFLYFVGVWNVQAQSIEDIIKNPPKPARLVSDYTQTLTADQMQALERKLFTFDDSTSTQIAVIIVDKLGGMDIADAATELGRSWKVGNKKTNNGVVVLIAKGDRKLNISPGYGLEKVLPDLTCQQIISDIFRPNFRGDDYYRGIDQGTDAIMQAVKGEFSAPANYRKDKFSVGKIFLIILVIIVLLSLFSGGGGGGGMMSRRGFRPFIFPVGGGGWGGGGSSSGGSFGGFGGGSFGGGGSSGSW
jgi:uncharacterized protein